MGLMGGLWPAVIPFKLARLLGHRIVHMVHHTVGIILVFILVILVISKRELQHGRLHLQGVLHVYVSGVHAGAAWYQDPFRDW